MFFELNYRETRLRFQLKLIFIRSDTIESCTPFCAEAQHHITFMFNRKLKADIKKRLEWYNNFTIYETITSGTDETTFSKIDIYCLCPALHETA